MSTATISPVAHIIPVSLQAPMTRDHLLSLVRYLVDGGGADRLVFETGGQPDYARARVAAESLRAQLGPFLDTQITVEQVCHRVTLTAVLPSFA